MKFTVIRRFRDKYTREIYLPGDAFISDEADRIQDLRARKLIEEAVQDYGLLTKRDLMALLDERAVEYNPKQTKAELIALLGGD